jgi:hypothetical protein
MAPFFNTKSLALLVIFFVLAFASSEASRGINPAATTAAATAINIDDLFSSAVVGQQQQQHAALRDYNPYADPNQPLNITVKCMLSILDFMTCMDYFTDETIPAPPEICCNGYMALSKSPACLCQILNVGWIRQLPNPTYLPHVVAAPALCGIDPSATPFPGCDAFMRKISTYRLS